jgi:two-component system response regulator HydG
VSGRVLVVDDERSMCETLEVVLQKRGFEVRWTTDPMEIPALLEATDADVIPGGFCATEQGA